MGRIKLLNYPFFIHLHLKINTDPQISIFKTAQSKIHQTDLTGNAKQTLSLLLLPKEMLQKFVSPFLFLSPNSTLKKGRLLIKSLADRKCMYLINSYYWVRPLNIMNRKTVSFYNPFLRWAIIIFANFCQDIVHFSYIIVWAITKNTVLLSFKHQDNDIRKS